MQTTDAQYADTVPLHFRGCRGRIGQNTIRYKGEKPDVTFSPILLERQTHYQIRQSLSSKKSEKHRFFSRLPPVSRCGRSVPPGYSMPASQLPANTARSRASITPSAGSDISQPGS